MQQLVSSRWYALAEFICATVIGFIILFQPRWGGGLVFLILLPWLIRVLLGGITFERTSMVIPFALIIITAIIGIWAAYDRPLAIEKLWVVISAIAVFAALVHQPRENMGVVASLVGLLGVIIVILFFATNDWQSQSSDFKLIESAGAWITANRPNLGGSRISPNFVAGLLAIIVPIALALAVYYLQARQLLKAILAAGMLLMVLGGLLLTSSRGAWIALLVAAATWLVWRLSEFLATKTEKPPLLLFGLLLLIILLPAVWVISTMPGGIVNLADSLPGLPTGGSRYSLASNTVKLIGDYPFTGGGLRSFPGQYSQYMLVIPYYLFSYSHNFYLDIVFEQGILGGLAVLVVILGAAGKLMAKITWENSFAKYLAGAVITSTFVILAHGMVDDPLYGDLGSPMLFLIPGIAFMLVGNLTAGIGSQQARNQNPNTKNSGRLFTRHRVLAFFLFILFIASALLYKPLLSSWYANLGAVKMAKLDLSSWPRDEWNADPNVDPYEPAQSDFDKSLALDKKQRTAWHRSGLVAAQAQDFETAQVELEEAHQIDPQHRGIRKSLGYVYTWNSQFDQAGILLAGIKEASQEMKEYNRWWKELKNPELADSASRMAGFLTSESSIP